MSKPAVILCWRCEHHSKVEVKSSEKPFFASCCAKEHTFGNAQECGDFVQVETVAET